MGEANSNTFSNLRTGTTFDNSGDPSARQVTKNELICLNTSSLVIESLIEQWCYSLDKNKEKCHKLYLTICETLYQKKLIDDSFRSDKFKFMRNHFQKAFCNVIKMAKCTQQEMGNQQLIPLPRYTLNHRSEQLFQWSRYRDDFQELEFIARGGFGHVFKAKNKLDNEIYAVKKIFLKYSDVNAFLRSLHEVQTLAKLNHPNIVSYKAAWLEPSETKIIPPETNKISDDDVEDLSPRLVNDRSSNVVFRNSNESSSSSHLSPKDSSNNLGDDSSGGNGRVNKSKSHGEVLKNESTSSGDESNECKAVYRHVNISPTNLKILDSNFQDSAILFIQMQLCKKTLRQWLYNRNTSFRSVDENLCLNLFEQIVSGVEYIHSKNIVHHDIKPSNIFISEDLRTAQVGDFGLACLLTHSNDHFHHDTNHYVMCPLEQRQFGTKLYAAPEQLKGICTLKSDSFSLGIVFFELFNPFMTEMERIKVVEGLQIGRLAPKLSFSPEITHIILKLLKKDLDQRPTAGKLLTTFKDINEMNSVAFKLRRIQTRIIKKLRLKLKEKEQIIANLQQKLKRYEEAEAKKF